VIDAVIATLRKGWCKKLAAVNAYGDQVDARDPNACAWCLVGAVKATLDFRDGYNLLHALDELIKPEFECLAYFNDACNNVDEVILFLEMASCRLNLS